MIIDDEMKIKIKKRVIISAIVCEGNCPNLAFSGVEVIKQNYLRDLGMWPPIDQFRAVALGAKLLKKTLMRLLLLLIILSWEEENYATNVLRSR